MKECTMRRSIKELLATEEIIRLFAISRVFDPILVEMFARTDKYHGFWLDQEHAGGTSHNVNVAALAARACDVDMFVRMPPTGYWQVTQCLEAGASGVMGAQITSAEHAREFVTWTKFAPAGVRGLNNSGSDANYTRITQAQFVEQANRDVLVSIQIETASALEEVEEIADLEGVDFLFVGPSDLSLALGVVGDFHHPRLWEAMERIAQACQKAGKTWGCVTPDPKFADRAISLGCRLPSMGHEILAMRRGVDALQEAFASVFSS
jgi:4-hydroxy-2-oxoheptanedioate aldolase